MSSQSLWYLSRATGVVSLLLLTLVLVLGIVVNRKGRLPGLPGFAVTGIHRNASLLAMVLLGVHIATAIIDPYASIRWVDAIVPFGSAYKPVWLGLGAFAFDLLIAIVITSLLRVRIGLRTWRAVHWASYLVWPVAALHGLRTGTDLTHGALLWVTLACVGIVATAVAWRVGGAIAEVPRSARTHAVLSHARSQRLASPRVGAAKRDKPTTRSR